MTNPLDGTTLYAAFVGDGPCTDDNSSTQVISTSYASAVSDPSTVVVEKDIKAMFNIDKKNTDDHSETLQFCPPIYGDSDISFGIVTPK